MPLKFKCLLASVLSLLVVTGAHAQQRFARGLVIYKSVPSDTPNYFNGVLFLSSSAGAIWKEYDIGQPKPFRITTDLFVTEIQFGEMFEADFTSESHLDFCKNIQSQLSVAAKQSPKISNVAKAAINAIQAEVDKYNKDWVRFRGNWVDRTVYLSTIDAEKKQKIAALNAKLEKQAEIDARVAANEAEEKRRKTNLSAPHAFPAKPQAPRIPVLPAVVQVESIGGGSSELEAIRDAQFNAVAATLEDHLTKDLGDWSSKNTIGRIGDDSARAADDYKKIAMRSGVGNVRVIIEASITREKLTPILLKLGFIE